jgi:hypothetical protein
MADIADEDVVTYAQRLARDTSLWQRVASGGPAAADAEWPQVLAALRNLQQQLQPIYPLTLSENPQQIFLSSAYEGQAFRRAPGQVLVDDYTMPADRSQWRLISTVLFGIDVVSPDESSAWLWRGTDGHLRTSEQLVNGMVKAMLVRERKDRGIVERT